jgi:hypothetical protein
MLNDFVVAFLPDVPVSSVYGHSTVSRENLQATSSGVPISPQLIFQEYSRELLEKGRGFEPLHPIYASNSRFLTHLAYLAS